MTPAILGRAMPAGLLAAGMLWASVTPAAAHGGPLVFAGEVGPYRVEAYRFFRSSAGQELMPYRIHLRSRSTGAQIEGAKVMVTVARDQEVIGPRDAVLSGEDYEVELLPIVEDGWMVKVDISGALGPEEITHRLPPPASFAEFASMYGLPMLLLAAIWIVRRRLRARHAAVRPTSATTDHPEC